VNPSDLQTLAARISVPIPHLQYLLEQLKLYVPGATVWAFGSRIKGSHHPASDLDLAVLCDKETALKILPKLNDIFIESNLPFKVQLLDFNRLPPNMQENIKTRYIVLCLPQEKKINNNPPHLSK
jgi:predicted nucleotidyltransferase